MIAPKKGLACHGRVTRISNIPEKWGSSSMRRQSVPGSFLKKRLGTRLIYTQALRIKFMTTLAQVEKFSKTKTITSISTIAILSN